MYIGYFVVPPILVGRPLFVVSEFDNKLRYLLAEVWGLRPHILPSDYAVRTHCIHLYHCCRVDDYVEDMLRLPISVISLDYTGEDLKPHPFGVRFQFLTGTAPLEIENGSGGPFGGRP